MAKNERFTIKQYKHPKTKKTSFRVQGYNIDGTRIRRNFKARRDAIEYKAMMESDCENGVGVSNLERTTLTTEQVRDAENAIKHLDSRTLTEVVINHTALEAMVRAKANMSLERAVRFFENHYKAEIQEITIYNAREKYLNSRRNQSPKTLEFQKNTTKLLLEESPNKYVHEFTLNDINDLLNKYNNPNSYKTYRNGINAFFNWAVRFKHCMDNPCNDLDAPPATQTMIAVLSLDEIKRLLKATILLDKGVMVSYITILLFAGLRPSELSDLKPALISLKSGKIRIEGGKLRRNLKRVVDIPPVLKMWLNKYPFSGIPRGLRNKVRKLKDLTEAKEWVADILRHTSISYQLARDESMGKVALQNGTSERQIEQNYLQVIDDEKAVKEFWNLTPDKIKALDIKIEITSRPNWPDQATLERMIAELPVTKVAQSIGVSDNAVRKRCRKLGIELPRRRGGKVAEVG